MHDRGSDDGCGVCPLLVFLAQSAKKSPLNAPGVGSAVHAKLLRVLDVEFIRDHARMVRHTPRAKL